MAHRKTLTARQLDLLQWVADGCPDGVQSDQHYRISAAALARRDLIRVKGRGPTWSAEITDAGAAYLKQAHAPDAEAPRQANTSVTQELVDRVVEAGGSILVPEKRWNDRAAVDYRQRALFAERFGKVPAGKRLEVTRVVDGQLRIDLVDAAEGELATQPVPVPDTVSRYHPVVKQFRDRSERHEVSRAALPRVSRILQGLVAEAERRGHSAALSGGGERQRHRQGEGWTGPRCGHLVITVEGLSTAIRVSEEGLQSRVHWERSNYDYSWHRLGFSEPRRPPLTDYEANATGQICLELVSGFGGHGRPAKFSDRKSWTLDSKLPELLHELEVRAAEAAERELSAQREADERQREWEAVRRRAFARHAEEQRAEVLRREAVRWREATQITAYCEAIESAFPDDVAARDWAAWGRDYVMRHDPLSQPPRAPEPPESVPADELRPYMEGWDVYEPRRQGW